jgi:hypothetical protein
MKRNPRTWSTLLLLGALLAPAQAFADVFLPVNGSISMVGMVSNRPAVVSWDGGSGCTRQNLQAGTGGLNASTTIWGSGIAGDWVIMTESFGDFCGFWVTPIVINGVNTLTVKGAGIGDVLEGRWIEKVVLGGDQGDDNLSSQISTWDRPLWGFTGKDTIIGGVSSTMMGEGDNDTMCTQPGATAFHANGGSGSNTFCGPNPFAGVVNTGFSCTGCP